MKISFIQPYYFNIWESIGVAYIAAYCKRRFHGQITYNFYQGYFDSDETIIEGARSSDIVAFSCTSPTFTHGVKLAKLLKEVNPGIRTVFGGYHVSALNALIEEEVIDQIVVGEGEKAFMRIINGDRERIIKGEPVSFDDLPWPDRELIRNQRTIELCEKMTGMRITSVQANRVCPFSCRYCAERVVTGTFSRTSNPVRSRDINDLLDEIECISNKYALDSFKFVDATFDTSSDYVISFCKEKIKRGIDIEWECMVHAGIAERCIFPWLKKANCKQINVGCESGSPRILREIKKGTTIEKIERVFEWAKQSGIKRRAFFLLGMPGEGTQDIIMTEKLIERIQPDALGVTILCPYPGSDLYDHESMKDIAWDRTDEYSNDFWTTEHLSNVELKKWQGYLVRKFDDRVVWHNTILQGNCNK